MEPVCKEAEKVKLNLEKYINEKRNEVTRLVGLKDEREKHLEKNDAVIIMALSCIVKASEDIKHITIQLEKVSKDKVVFAGSSAGASAPKTEIAGSSAGAAAGALQAGKGPDVLLKELASLKEEFDQKAKEVNELFSQLFDVLKKEDNKKNRVKKLMTFTSDVISALGQARDTLEGLLKD